MKYYQNQFITGLLNIYILMHIILTDQYQKAVDKINCQAKAKGQAEPQGLRQGYVKAMSRLFFEIFI